MFHRCAAALLLAFLICCACARDVADPKRRRLTDIFLRPDTATVKDRVPQHATLATLLRDLEMRADQIPTIVQKTTAVFDPRRLHAGNAFHLVRTTDGLLRDFQYEIDTDRYLRLAATPGEEAATLRAEIVPYDKQRALISIRGEIKRDAPSLFAAMDQAGETPELSLALAEIFSGEIDFNTELQPGDTFTVAFERVFREGEPVGYGQIVAAEFDNEGRRHRAILFTPPGGKPGYYDEQGRSLRRFFLASPLKFTFHVTSGFTRSRFHPILRIYRPHLGVDYGAPMGSPVVAVANGVVLSAGVNGEGGRVVHLRHASGYETYYMHLSAIAPGVRAGAHVTQGQLIGKVGMSGLATGPHLDYRIKQGSTFRNPLLIKRTLPPGEPIAPGAMAQFATERDRALARLIPAPAAASPGAH
jgi:murein DD-endopeptidase MepM/ murein hydrolase activator NlpD